MNEEQQREIYQEALIQAREKEYKNALGILEKRIRKIDRRYTYYLYHGIFTQQQDLIKYSPIALEDYMKAYSFNPNTYSINDVIGCAYLYMKQYDQAILYLEKAYALYDPESGAPPPYWDLAESYLHVGRLEEAMEMNVEALEENPAPWVYFQKGVILSELGNIQALKDNYQIAKQMAPGDIMLDRDYALQLIKINELEKASQLYDAWLKGQENYYDWCYADLGYISMLKGDWNNSFKLMQKAEKINNTTVLTLKYLSFYYFFVQDFNKDYEYESRTRLQTEPSGRTSRKKSVDEFVEGYKGDWQFQKLLLSQENGNAP
ncbi:MAG: tetratricopeptide repeat protein [Treponema sp.]|jgi:tetratricopeptide (TPR) repeat protein|nr:tetratricopeptide repeat protein [Treponema sp.]